MEISRGNNVWNNAMETSKKETFCSWYSGRFRWFSTDNKAREEDLTEDTKYAYPITTSQGSKKNVYAKMIINGAKHAVKF